jgi:hypothetical protein
VGGGDGVGCGVVRFWRAKEAGGDLLSSRHD